MSSIRKKTCIGWLSQMLTFFSADINTMVHCVIIATKLHFWQKKLFAAFNLCQDSPSFYFLILIDIHNFIDTF